LAAAKRLSGHHEVRAAGAAIASIQFVTSAASVRRAGLKLRFFDLYTALMKLAPARSRIHMRS
jgi:hypothetical protein